MPGLSSLLRDMAMSSSSNSNLNLNYTPAKKHTTTTVTECSDTASLSSQKTLVGKVFGRKSSESSTRSKGDLKGSEAVAKETKAAARAHYFSTL